MQGRPRRTSGRSRVVLQSPASSSANKSTKKAAHIPSIQTSQSVAPCVQRFVIDGDA